MEAKRVNKNGLPMENQSALAKKDAELESFSL